MRIELDHTIKRYGSNVALSVDNWSAGPGDIVGLVGSNGAGKTTFLRLVLDLLKATEGRVLIDEREVSSYDGWKACTGSYLDTSFLIDFLTPVEYFYFAGSIYGKSRSETEAALAPFWNLLRFARDSSSNPLIRELSTGNAKKVGIVAALFVRPDLLVLDEPFANLDPPSQIRLKNHIRRLAETHRSTMIISSHDLGHVTDICTRVTLLDDGKIVRDDAASDATLAELQTFFAG